MEAKRRPKRGQESQKGERNLQEFVGSPNFWAPGPPKGLQILEKAAMLAANCRLQDWKDWRPRVEHARGLANLTA